MTFDHGLNQRQLDCLRSTLSPFAACIERVAVFGSRATGQYRPNSDIDLVLYGPVEEKTIDRLYTLFMDSSLPLKVDMQAYAHIAHPPLRQHIDEVGKTLFVREELLESFAKRSGI
jgi:predicted nucleotidyltransferase